MHANAGSLVPGGVGGVTGGGEILGPEAKAAPLPVGVTAALGASSGPQALKSKIKTAIRPHLTGR